MEGKPGAAAEDKRVARAEAEGVGGLAALQPADAEQAGIAKRNRDHRRIEILLVAILMQTHFRGRAVEVDQTGLRRVRISGKLVPYCDERRGYRWPGPSSVGVRRLIPVPALIRY